MTFIDLDLNEKIEIFTQKLLQTDISFDYYIDWENITGLDNYQVEINAIDVLVQNKNDEKFKKDFYELLKRVPQTIVLFPFLFGLSKKNRKSMAKGNNELVIFQNKIDEEKILKYSFRSDCKKLSNDNIEKYYNFFKQMGLKNLFQNIIEKSTLDYINGVLVGLDSNGRKNRGGKAFELACYPIFDQVCKKYNIEFISQKQFKILRKYGFTISEYIENRKADFIVFSSDHSKAINFEVNFYNGGGSKPEEIIDSYINRQSELDKSGIVFSLVTDGKNCWDPSNKMSKSQLIKGFNKIKYLQNFYMLKHGMLEEIIKKELL